MTPINRYDGLDPRAVRTVKSKIRSLVGFQGLTSVDLEDLEQELMLDVVCSVHRFDQQRGNYGQFLGGVIQRRVALTIKARRAQKRDVARTCSLNDPLPGERGDEGDEFIDLLSSDSSAHDTEMDLHTVLDVRRICRLLSPELRDLCVGLVEGNQVSVAKEMGITPRTARRWTRHVRELFLEAGMGAYGATSRPIDAVAR
jgi:DNA-directed RNA polymerase specialized sigma24 family protein